MRLNQLSVLVHPSSLVLKPKLIKLWLHLSLGQSPFIPFANVFALYSIRVWC